MSRPAPDRIRVVRVLGALDIGGAELRTLELLPALVDGGVEAHFVTLSGRAGVLADRAARLGARVHPIRLDLRFPVRFVRLLRRLRADVVHSDVATFSGAVVALAALAGVPVRVAHFRSDGDGRADTARRLLQRAVMRRLIALCATDVLGVSPGALHHGYSPDWPADGRCRVAPNGLDPDRLRGTPTVDLRAVVGAAPDDTLCVHLGRPAPVKRRWLVPPVIAALAEAGRPARAVFVGSADTTDDALVVRAAQQAGVGDRVHLIGPTDEAPLLIAQADVLLLPSEREGLPGVVLEALAVGTPVVATDLPGTRFLAAHLPGITLVDAAATAGQWSGHVRAALARPVTPADRREATRRFAASVFSLERAASTLLELYRGRLGTVSHRRTTEPSRPPSGAGGRR